MHKETDIKIPLNRGSASAQFGRARRILTIYSYAGAVTSVA